MRRTFPLDAELAAALVNIPVYDLERLDQTRALDRSFGDTLAVAASREETLAGKVVVSDLVVPGAGGVELKARVYRPADPLGKPPVLLMCHGGAFCLGDLNTEDFRSRRYVVGAGVAVLVVDYRLAPEFPFPVPFEDCYSALLWLGAHADTMGLDQNRIGVAGESAGGGLAAALALAARDRKGPGLAAQMLLFPALDHRMTTLSIRAGQDYPAWNSVQTKIMWSYYLGETEGAVSPYASPALAVDLTGLPPACIFTAEFDPLCDEALDYGNRLLAASVRSEIHHTLGTYHVYDAVWPLAAISDAALRQQETFLKTTLA